MYAISSQNGGYITISVYGSYNITYIVDLMGNWFNNNHLIASRYQNFAVEAFLEYVKSRKEYYVDTQRSKFGKYSDELY